MERTRLSFVPKLEWGMSLELPQALLDETPFDPGANVSLGRHRLEIRHSLAVSFSTNLFICYGGQNLGVIKLNRAKGILRIAVDPPAGEITISGGDLRLKLDNGRGMTSSVPTGTYMVRAAWWHYERSEEVQVHDSSVDDLRITAPLGALHLRSSHDSTRFVLRDEQGRSVAQGELPQTVVELPTGIYRLDAERLGQRRTASASVKVGLTNEVTVEFQYGEMRIETDPPGATVSGANGESLGITPVTLSNLQPGDWRGELRLDGYVPIHVSASVVSGQAISIQTNLVSRAFSAFQATAMQYCNAGEIDRAIALAREQHLSSKEQAAAEELVHKTLIAKAKSLAEKNKYQEAVGVLVKALTLSPDSKQAKALLKDYNRRAPR
jgi:hypothetical protein